LVSPDTVQLSATVVVQVLEPGLEVTVYPVMALPPLKEGAVQETKAEAFPAAAVTPVGEPGTVAGVTGDDVVDGAPVPAELVAVTVKV
jgi:hypothetical protein